MDRQQPDLNLADRFLTPIRSTSDPLSQSPAAFHYFRSETGFESKERSNGSVLQPKSGLGELTF